MKCKRPPAGWWCSIEAGHDGPCAAWPTWWTANRIALKNRWEAIKATFHQGQIEREEYHHGQAEAIEAMYRESKRIIR